MSELAPYTFMDELYALQGASDLDQKTKRLPLFDIVAGDADIYGPTAAEIKQIKKLVQEL